MFDQSIGAHVFESQDTRENDSQSGGGGAFTINGSAGNAIIDVKQGDTAKNVASLVNARFGSTNVSALAPTSCVKGNLSLGPNPAATYALKVSIGR